MDEAECGPTLASSSHRKSEQTLDPHTRPWGHRVPLKTATVAKLGAGGEKVCDFLYLRFWRQSKGFQVFLESSSG